MKTEVLNMLLGTVNPYWLLTLHCVIGVGAAIIAQQKGLNLTRWVIWGLIGGTAALITALAAKPKAE